MGSIRPAVLCMPMLTPFCCFWYIWEGDLLRISLLSTLQSDSCRKKQFILAFVWGLALGLGSLFAFTTQPVTLSLMCIAPMCHVSIFGLVVILLFPLLLSAIAVKFSVSGIIYLIVLVDGISFGYFMLGTVLAFGSPAWLIGLMLAFSKLALIVPLLSFYLQCFSNKDSLMPSFINCFFAAMIIGMLDYLVVSPFLISIVADR